MTTLLDCTLPNCEITHGGSRSVWLEGPSLKMSAAVKKRKVVAEWKTLLMSSTTPACCMLDLLRNSCYYLGVQYQTALLC